MNSVPSIISWEIDSFVGDTKHNHFELTSTMKYLHLNIPSSLALLLANLSFASWQSLQSMSGCPLFPTPQSSCFIEARLIILQWEQHLGDFLSLHSQKKPPTKPKQPLHFIFAHTFVSCCRLKAIKVIFICICSQGLGNPSWRRRKKTFCLS